ncbi:Amidohydro-rel domain-containing protein [Mycena indigotica]|uniref:Amidohydro-rel domain-containing protein n=1 Tax=Mycena indigotica TaxID=2126181 RepID=A0A8H6SG44_9AGAR|nr:Amidohydro-rel domain-containing protein [Mycena indigotica]KAF7298970.1 Amidohydro-rel domain-containing protein [Mycena indigotica]
MFSTIATSFVAFALATGAMAGPLAAKRTLGKRHSCACNKTSSDHTTAARGEISFDNWGGISSLQGFDNFYGSDDFAHYKHFSPVVVRQDEPELVCHSEQVVIVQQRLAVLQEMAKKIITEQLCEVESQSIVFQQYYASLGGYSHDLTRSSGRHVGYDGHIASYYNSIYNSDGSLSNYDFNFTGSDIGSNYYVPTSNWNDQTSYSSVNSAYQASQAASYYSY